MEAGALGPFNALFLPLFPATVERFFEAIFQVEGWTQIVVLNDFMAIYTVIFWLGLFDVLRAVVVPTGYLDVLLSKPLSRSRYLFAKLAPAFGSVALVGLVGGLAHGLSAAWVGPLDAGAFAAGVAVTIGLAALCCAVVTVATLYLRETYHAIVIGFAIWMATLLPGSIYMYRPDVFTRYEGLHEAIVYPMNVVWMDASGVTIAWLVSAASIVLVAAIVGAAGWLFERRDVG